VSILTVTEASIKKPLEPLIIEMIITDLTTGKQINDLSPHLFTTVELINPEDGHPVTRIDQNGRKIPILGGKTVCSLNRVKKPNQEDQYQSIFHFGDLTVSQIGFYYMRIRMFDIQFTDTWAGPCFLLQHQTECFQVVPHKDYKQASKSTTLVEHLSDQGIRLKVHKQPGGKKRAIQEVDDYEDAPLYKKR
jgi:hypothetical protein